MTRFIIAIVALVTTATSLAAVHNATTRLPAPAVQTIDKGKDGKPILLKRMVVTATALPDGESDTDAP